MHKLPSLLLLLLLAAARLHAQGICDSTISIDPIQPICAGTGEAYLTVSHPGGVFSGPGLIYNNEYLSTKYLAGGFYTATYTITGPGGCTVTASRTFEVLQAEQAFTSVSGNIDCSNPNSLVTLDAFVLNSNAYWGGDWEGPNGANLPYNSYTVTTKIAGEYQFMAYPMNFNDCPAYGNVVVSFHNNPLNIHLVSCTNCNGPNIFSIKIDTIPPGWTSSISHGNAGYFGQNGCIPIHASQSGVWNVSVTNPQNGCKSSDSRNFPVIASAIPAVSAGSTSGIGCGVQGRLLGATSANGGLLQISWSTTDGHIVADGNTLFPLIDQPGTYTLTAINTFTGCSGSDDTYVGLAPPPLTTQISVICDGESLNGHTESGTYFDTIYQANGCFKTQVIKLFVLAPLLDSVIVDADHGQMTGSIEYNVTQGWPPFVYAWSNGETTASIDQLSAGTYTITVTDANDCQHIREIVVPLNRPFHRLALDREIPAVIKARLYPNPALAGWVDYTLEIYATKAEEATLLLNDVLGRTILSRSIQIQEGKNVLSIAENLQKGVYTVFLKGDFGTQVASKLVVSDAK